MKKYTRKTTYEFVEQKEDGSVILRLEGTEMAQVVSKETFEKDFVEVKVAKRGK